MSAGSELEHSGPSRREQASTLPKPVRHLARTSDSAVLLNQPIQISKIDQYRLFEFEAADDDRKELGERLRGLCHHCHETSECHGM